ncbi:unnamed protein product, partial [Musa hybrid cultivar]
LTEEYELSTYDRHELNYNQIALSRLPHHKLNYNQITLTGDYTIQTVMNSTQIKIHKDKPLDSRTITDY